jgi:NAD(P)-dependent dehydrogenase (short-subunit alcohol dehydrogenase family)
VREFDGKVAVVTGAASGMGRAFAERFAEAGMKVVLADVEEQPLQATVQALQQREFDVLGVQADVSSSAAVDDLARRTIDAYGKVHIVCNNAGVAADSEVSQLLARTGPRVWEQPLADWEWTFAVNLMGVVHGIRAFVPLMLAQGEPAHIVNTASIAGLTSGPTLPIYGTSKHAVVRLSEALYLQLQQANAPIGVSVLCPGGVNTRIALATRNRPEALRNAAEQQPNAAELEAREQEWATMTGERGLAPASVAETVFRAIEEDRFYILTHPELDGGIRRRMENILARQNPG